MADIETLKKKHAFESVEEIDIVKTNTRYSQSFKDKLKAKLEELRKLQHAARTEG